MEKGPANGKKYSKAAESYQPDRLESSPNCQSVIGESMLGSSP